MVWRLAEVEPADPIDVSAGRLSALFEKYEPDVVVTYDDNGSYGHPEDVTFETELTAHHGAAFVSVVGLGLGVLEVSRAEQALERAGIPLVALRTTPTALIFRLAEEHAESAVQAMHAAFLERA